MKQLVKVIFNMNHNPSDYRDFTSRMENPKEYVFAAFEPLSEGDAVIVDTRNGFQIATVAGIAERLPRNVPVGDLKEVVCKVDFSAFVNRKEKAEKRKTLEASMKKKVKELQEIAVYEMLAEKDPALKAMLVEYQSLKDE